MPLKRVGYPKDNDIPLKIMFAVITANKPLTMSGIARQAKVSRQLVNYHIPPLIGAGLLIPYDVEDKELVYSTQPFLMDDKIFKEIGNLFEPVIKKIAENLILDKEMDPENVLKNNISLFLKTLKITL